MFAICQNDYPIGIAQTEEIVNKLIKCYLNCLMVGTKNI